MNESAGQGGRGNASEGIILGPGEGRTIPGTDAMTLKETGGQTGGSIGVLEAKRSHGIGVYCLIHCVQVEKFCVVYEV